MSFNITRHIGLRFTGAAVLLSALTATTAAAGQVARSTGNGTYISVSGSDTSGCIWFYMYASRGGTTQAPQTYVYYDVYNGCSGQWIAYGGGRVANTALKATKKSATLNVTSANNADFYSEGSTGSVTLTITADGLGSYSYSGHSRSEFAGHMYQSHGTWTSKTATASGSILGFDIGNASASLGEGRDKVIEIERGSK
jgi:hypothetical protein